MSSFTEAYRRRLITHDELIAAGGRYRTMFDLQASRFGPAGAEEEGVAYDVLS